MQPTFTLGTPRSMSFDSSGNMYVADESLCIIVKFPSCGTVYPTVFAGVRNNCSSGTSNLNSPEGAFLDSLGNLYVVSRMKMNEMMKTNLRSVFTFYPKDHHLFTLLNSPTKKEIGDTEERRKMMRVSILLLSRLIIRKKSSDNTKLPSECLTTTQPIGDT